MFQLVSSLFSKILCVLITPVRARCPTHHVLLYFLALMIFTE